MCIDCLSVRYGYGGQRKRFEPSRQRPEASPPINLIEVHFSQLSTGDRDEWGLNETRKAQCFTQCLHPADQINDSRSCHGHEHPCSHSCSVVTCEVTLIVTNSHINLQSVLLSVRLQPSGACWSEGFFPASNIDIDIALLVTILLSTDSLVKTTNSRLCK